MNLILYLLLPLAFCVDVYASESSQSARSGIRTPRRALRRLRGSVTSESVVVPEKVSPSRASFVPREIIKFELADAKVPDFHPQFQKKNQDASAKPKPVRRTRQRRVKPTESTATASSIVDQDKPEARDGGDEMGSASRIMQISHPIPATYESTSTRQRVVKELPFGVQKAITHALKQDYNIPYLDTIKYYIKDPAVRTSATKLSVTPKPLTGENRLKQWWLPASSIKASPTAAPTSTSFQFSTTNKPIDTPDTANDDYGAYPLLRAYPVQYSMNLASDIVGGIGYLYGDRIYSRNPFTQGKAVDSSNSLFGEVSVRPLDTSKTALSDDFGDEYITVTPNSISSSTSPIQFPLDVETQTMKSLPAKSHVKYYAAVPTDASGVPLSSDKNTIHFINKAVNAIKKHNPHLDVVPKKIENDELTVHVTPKPEFFKPSDATKTFTSSKNLAYMKPHQQQHQLHQLHQQQQQQKFVEIAKPISELVANKQKVTKVVNHHYLKQFQVVAPANRHHDDDLFESGYAFGYRVRDHITGNDFGHHQKRMVDGTTHGQYKILMPDGRTQNVKYKADDHGYHADVSYEE